MCLNRKLYFVFIFLISANVLLAQYQNVRINSIKTNEPEEVSIAINPTNPLNLAAGANINLNYHSTDGGLTWQEGRLSSTFGVWGDPCVTFDPDGNLYFGHLSTPQTNGYWIDRIVVQKSTDGGTTYDNGVGIGYSPPRKEQDKEWLIADHTNSIYRGNLYMAWTEFDEYGSPDPRDSSRILFSYSSDQGLSWSQPTIVSDRSGDCFDGNNTDEGAVPAVGPNGEVYLSWAGPLGIMFDKSTDGGQSFGKDIFVSNQPGGWAFDVPGINRCNGLPVTICDISNSPYKGNIYINWSDQRSRYKDTDIFLIKSTDGGKTWSDVKKVNGDKTNRHQFFTWATVDPKTGYLYIVYYDRRNTTDNATDVYMAKSIDGGDTFTETKISSSSFTPVSNIFFGDYTNIAAYDGKVYPIWMRMDGIKLSIWTALIDDKQTDVKRIGNESVPELFLLKNYPNPFNPSTTIHYSIPEPGFVTLTVFDQLGREIKNLVNELQTAGIHSVKFNATYHSAGLQSGIYFYKLSVNNSSGNILVKTNKMILLK
ncbi:MAG: T9SS type A sorting domain-containing protein [Ignavibacteriales bacterium]|nr:T9SS type A sorting domain-containing protein [Ignavibacteriales bacterium]